MPEEKVFKGLNGVNADYTKVSTVGQHTAGLTYRGYAIEDLAAKCEFEEVAYLLIRGVLPNTQQLKAYKAMLAANRSLPPALATCIEQLPKHAHPMDVLRTASSVMGCLEPEKDHSQVQKTAERVMPLFVTAMCYWHHFTQHGTRIKVNVNPNDNMACAFLKMLAGNDNTPTPLAVQTVNASFILYAEHDFNASTFAARVVTSTLSDTYSSITAAIGALRGPLHGGANEAVMDMIVDLKTPAEGLDMIRKKLKSKDLVMGFGHRIYKNGDPRNAVFRDLSEALSKTKTGKPHLFAISRAIEDMMEKEKKMYPNADFYAASAYHQAGVPTHFFTPLFVVARTSGWVAHVLEQLDGNKIIRPTSVYNGPDKKPFLGMDERPAAKM